MVVSKDAVEGMIADTDLETRMTGELMSALSPERTRGVGSRDAGEQGANGWTLLQRYWTAFTACKALLPRSCVD